MRATDLPSPGILASGQTLRHTVTHAISRAQINLSRNPESDTPDDLLAFFEDCAIKCNEIIIAAGGEA